MELFSVMKGRANRNNTATELVLPLSLHRDPLPEDEKLEADYVISYRKSKRETLSGNPRIEREGGRERDRSSSTGERRIRK